MSGEGIYCPDCGRSILKDGVTGHWWCPAEQKVVKLKENK